MAPVKQPMFFSNSIFNALRERALDIQIDRNQVEKIWSFVSPDPVMDMPRTMDFGDDIFAISIIDQFARCRPQLMNFRSLDDRDIQFIPTVILDSNVSTYMTQFVFTPGRLNSIQRHAVKALIEHLVRTKYDYNPFFYYIEVLAKDDPTKSYKHLVEETEAILRLHSMDEALFLQTGEIKPARDTFNHYAEKFGTDSYKEMARRQVEWTIAKNPFPELRNLYFAIYICLLKIALIQLEGQGVIQEKVIQLREFMIDNLKVIMGRELFVGLNYFAGLLSRFIPVNRGADFSNVIQRLQASAWDVLLLSFPDHFLAHGWPEPVTLAYICSADRALQKIGKATRITAILCLKPFASSPISVLQYSYDEIIDKLGADIVGSLIREHEQWQLDRWKSYQLKMVEPNEKGLSDIIRGLEEEIQSICEK